MKTNPCCISNRIRCSSKCSNNSNELLIIHPVFWGSKIAEQEGFGVFLGGNFKFRGDDFKNAAGFGIASLIQLQDREVTPQKAVIEGLIAVAAAPLNHVDQSKKLAELRDAGIISKEEFQAKKTEILEKI